MMFDANPLADYHAALRATRSSGYPSMQYLAPHPYEMAFASLFRHYRGDPFGQYQQGRQMRMPVRQGLQRGLPHQRVRYPQQQQVGFIPPPPMMMR